MTTRKTKGNPRIDEALLELAQDFRGTLLSNETAGKITMRILGDKAPAKPAPDLIRAPLSGARRNGVQGNLPAFKYGRICETLH